MLSTNSKTIMRLAMNSRFAVYLKKQGEIELIQKSDAEEQYKDYCGLINRCQWAVRPQRP